MKDFAPGWFPGGALAAIALCCVLPRTLSGGEAIQFSNARSRQDPTAKSNPVADKEKLGRISPLDYMPSGSDSTRRDPLRDRKARHAATEKANWMVLDRGQLDEQDEKKRSSGMRDATFEKESDRKSYFFDPADDQDELPGLPGRPRSPFARSSSRDRSEPEAKETPGSGGRNGDNAEPRRNQVVGKDGQPLGEHTAKELDLRDVLSPGKANSLAPSLAPNGDKTALLWQTALGGSGDPGRRRDEATTADSYRGSIPAGTPGSADSFNFRNDLNTRAAAPFPAGASESPARRFSLPAAPAAPRASDAGIGRSPGLYSSPAVTDPYGSRYGSPAGGIGPDPGYRSQPAQRSSSGSFQIPARPGYGGR